MDERYTVLGEYEDAVNGCRVSFALRVSSWEPYCAGADYNAHLWVFRRVGQAPRRLTAVLAGWPDLIESADRPYVIDSIRDARPRPVATPA